MCPAPAANGRAVCDAGACRIVCDPMFVQAGNNCERVPMNCGNRTLDAGESCDDGNVLAGDGCSPMCALEANTSTISCAGTRTPLQISRNQTIRFRGATSGNDNVYDGCDAGRAQGPELVFELQLMQAGSITSRVTPGTSWDLALRGGPMCPGLCVDRAGDGASEGGTLGPYPAGTRFFLIVDGFRNDESGSFTIETTLSP
jgi:cysteine-rich repeat protein